MLKTIGNHLRDGQKGFTLVELLVVIAILGVLSGVAAPNVTRFIGKADIAAANAELGLVRTAVGAAQADGRTSAVSSPGTLSNLTDITVVPGYTVGAYIQNGVGALTGTYTINSQGIITGATHTGATYNATTCSFS